MIGIRGLWPKLLVKRLTEASSTGHSIDVETVHARPAEDFPAARLEGRQSSASRPSIQRAVLDVVANRGDPPRSGDTRACGTRPRLRPCDTVGVTSAGVEVRFDGCEV